MPDRPFELDWTPEGMVAQVRLRGGAVLASPTLNRGTAFTHAERDALRLTGLLPEGVSTIEGQLRRVDAQYQRQPDDLAKNSETIRKKPSSFGECAAKRSVSTGG